MNITALTIDRVEVACTDADYPRALAWLAKNGYTRVNSQGHLEFHQRRRSQRGLTLIVAEKITRQTEVVTDDRIRTA